MTAAGAMSGATLHAAGWKRRAPHGQPLVLDRGAWELETPSDTLRRYTGQLRFANTSTDKDVMIPELSVEATLLSDAPLDGIRHRIRVTTHHPNFPGREDGYWEAYIVESQRRTMFEVELEVEGENLDELHAAWIRVNYVSYGHVGRFHETQHAVLPMRFPEPREPEVAHRSELGEVLLIRTHLLHHLDDPAEVVERYVAPYAQPGDVVAMGETPLAIMQGRYRHPDSIEPGRLARGLCKHFLPTSSLATACGMQNLIDMQGPARVAAAFAGGALARAAGKHGVFYMLAGEQARLIDDVTGTLPPYDKFIVLGPDDPNGVVHDVRRRTGLEAAVVDANDLGIVEVLARTPGASEEMLCDALRANPQGNASEQTPLMIVRPRR
jgi:hypothetical protein